MRMKIDVALDYQIVRDDPVLLTLEIAETDGQVITASTLDIESARLHRIDGEFGLGQRLWATGAGERLCLRYSAEVNVTRPDAVLEGRVATPLRLLPTDALTSLRPSRFCPSDLFTDFAEHRFGHLEGGAKVAAVLDWVRTEIEYVPGSSNATTTAIDTFTSHQGVCRDFAHLMCSLLRAANIPARYASAYGPEVQPPDFHAVTQVWLDGAWHLLDPTGMCSASGIAVIGVGRDAADVPFMETSEWAQLNSQSITVSQS